MINLHLIFVDCRLLTVCRKTVCINTYSDKVKKNRHRKSGARGKDIYNTKVTVDGSSHIN